MSGCTTESSKIFEDACESSPEQPAEPTHNAYELQREARIASNKARMVALGVRTSPANFCPACQRTAIIASLS